MKRWQSHHMADTLRLLGAGVTRLMGTPVLTANSCQVTQRILTCWEDSEGSLTRAQTAQEAMDLLGQNLIHNYDNRVRVLFQFQGQSKSICLPLHAGAC
eukprot:4881045-Amphidinium_carterae.1